MPDHVYRIPLVNFPALENKIEALNRRARKIGCNEIKLNVIREVVEKREDGSLGFDYDFIVRECTVEGEIPHVKGWKFIAIVEPIADTGENIIREVPNEKCPEEFRTTDLQCNHCNSSRDRKSVFILRHKDGSHKQVGRNCLNDFLAGSSPDAMMSGAELMMDLNSLLNNASDECWGHANSGTPVIPIHQYVSVVAIVMQKMGWVPKSKAQEGKPATALIAYDICTNPHAASVKKLIKQCKLDVSDVEVKLAQDAIQWASKIDPTTAQNNYMYDLGVCCRSKYVSRKTMGFVASCVDAYQRQLAYDLQNKMGNPVGKHLGVIGQRMIFEDLTIICMNTTTVKTFTCTWVRFVDKQGNILAWRASGSPDWLRLELVVTVIATVEKHSRFGGTLQTIISRVMPHEQPVVPVANDNCLERVDNEN